MWCPHQYILSISTTQLHLLPGNITTTVRIEIFEILQNLRFGFHEYELVSYHHQHFMVVQPKYALLFRISDEQTHRFMNKGLVLILKTKQCGV